MCHESGPTNFNPSDHKLIGFKLNEGLYGPQKPDVWVLEKLIPHFLWSERLNFILILTLDTNLKLKTCSGHMCPGNAQTILGTGFTDHGCRPTPGRNSGRRFGGFPSWPGHVPGVTPTPATCPSQLDRGRNESGELEQFVAS